MSYENEFFSYPDCQYATNAPPDIFTVLQPNSTRLESEPGFYMNAYGQQLPTPYMGFMIPSATADASAYSFQRAISASLCSQAEGAALNPEPAPSLERTAWLPCSTYLDPFDNSEGNGFPPSAVTSMGASESTSVWPPTPDEPDISLQRVSLLAGCLVLNIPEHTALDPEKALALAQSLRNKNVDDHDPMLVQFLLQLERLLQTDTPLVSAFGLLLWREGLRSVSKELSGMWDRFLGRVMAFQKSRRMGERKRTRCPRPIKGNKRSTSFLRRNSAHAFDQQPNSCGRRMSNEVPSRGLRNQHLMVAPTDEHPPGISVDRRAQQKRAEKAARERERRRRQREARKAQSPAPDLDALRAKLEALRKAAGISEKDAQRCYNKFDFSVPPPVPANCR